MYRDMFGKNRMKINFHMHTTLSDGDISPEEAAKRYKDAGYDAVAITDHWKYGEKKKIAGLRILSGAEYNIGGMDARNGIYHILAIGCEREPSTLTPNDRAQVIVDAIHANGGMAVLAHPNWSLNTVVNTEKIIGFDATEIYNSVSDVHESSRPYSGYFADAVACTGRILPLIADDDTHYYDGTDETHAYIMLECEENATDKEILDAVKKGKFYATTGPEAHIVREGDEIAVYCSSASRIAFYSNIVWSEGHGHTGDGLTEARTKIMPHEAFIRAEVTDKDGRTAWTNYIEL